MRASAPAKINLGLVVGPLRADGKHELLTVYQRIGLADRIDVEDADGLTVEGFAGDTIVRTALELLAERAGIAPRWRVRIEKRLPVAAGLGGGSSDAATALRLANATARLDDEALHALAARVGADVPFFLCAGPQLGSGDGTTLEPLDLPQDFWIVLVLPRDAQKESTRAVYGAFDDRGGADGWSERSAAFRDALAAVRRPRDLAALPANDLVRSPHVDGLRARGAFHADVSGAGPTVYGLFHHRADADRAGKELRRVGPTWVTAPAWYG